MGYFINPKRKNIKGFLSAVVFYLKLPLISLGAYLGFFNADVSHVNGDVKRVSLGKNCSTMDTLFNTVSGTIRIGDDTVFGHHCMVLTGRHRFYQGRRAKLVPGSEHFRETPESGYDIEIGSGCFIGSGAIILAPVKIGDNVIVGSGAVVVDDVPGNCFVAGVPAKVIKFHDEEAPDAGSNG